MAKLLYTVGALLLVNAFYAADAVAIGKCVDELTASLTNKVETCLAMTSYVKCILLETNLYKTPNKEEDLKQFKSQFEAGLSEKGVNCDIDVNSIVEELLENDRMGIERSTTKPTGYKNARTIGDCIDTLAAESRSSLNCASLKPYLKCFIRVLNLYKQPFNSTQEENENLKNTIKDRMSKLNIECDIDFAGLMKEVRQEEGIEHESGSETKGQDNGSATIVSSLSLVTVLISTYVSMIAFH